jgi:hypothetical protein
MKYILVTLFSSLVFAEQLFTRSLRSEWTKLGMITSMSAAQAMNISGAKAAYKNSLLYLGNKKNSLPFGISLVGFKDAKVTNSIGVSYNAVPKDLSEFANASGALMAYMAGACLGISEQNSKDFAQFFFETIAQAQKTGKAITAKRQFDVYNIYIGNATVKALNISYSLVISSSGVLGKNRWLEYCNPKQ